VGGFKARAARWINRVQGTTGVPRWQRSFFDRIIRDENQLRAAIEYIRLNPQR